MSKVRGSGRRRKGRLPAAAAALALVVLAVTGCSKKPRPVPLPPPVTSSAETEAAAPREVDPAAPLPELEIFLEPAVVSPGETAILRWETLNADRVVIAPDIGPVIVSGKLKLYPEATATYQVTAEGPGGAVTKSATLDVAAGGGSGIWDDKVDSSPLGERFKTAVKPVFFDFDSADLTAEARITLDGNVRWLTRPENREIRLLVEGHCDERGTEQYNLALGDKRSQVVRAYLVSHGVAPSRVSSVSLGEERPFARGASEEDYALNRRAHFVLLGENR